jgi:probable rRNA maturation factor
VAPLLSIEIADCQQAVAYDASRLVLASQSILRDAGVTSAQLSIAIVDDETIHQLNRQFLAHDYPTDVLSFLLERAEDRLEGEVVASAETAHREAEQFGWSAADELLLYVVHGVLHLVGHDDTDALARSAMRDQERRYLSEFGLVLDANHLTHC